MDNQADLPVPPSWRKFWDIKTLKKLGCIRSILLLCGAILPRWIFLHIVSLILSAFLVPFSIDVLNSEFNSHSVLPENAYIARNITDLVPFIVPMIYQALTFLCVSIFSCNLLKCGSSRLANFDPRRSVYFRRYIIPIAFFIFIDGSSFATMLFFVIYQQIWIRKMNKMEATNYNYIVNDWNQVKSTGNKVYYVSIFFTLFLGICFVDDIVTLVSLIKAGKQRKEYVREEFE